MAENEAQGEGTLPERWMWTTLDEGYEIVMGQSPPSSTYNTEHIGLPFYQGKAEFGDLYPTPVKWCSAPGKVAEAGDVLISVRAPVGPTNLCREESCIGRGLAAIRPQGEMPNLYLLYFLRYIEQDWESKATGTTFSAISSKTLREQEIPLAPLPEQRRIVAEIETQFTRLDAAVAALERAQANIRRYKAAVLKAACEGRLVPTEAELARAESRDHEPADQLLARILAERRARWEAEHPGKRYKEPAPPDTESLPELPEGWMWVTVEQIGDVRLGRQRSPKHHQGPFMRPYLRAANATWNGVDLSDVKEMNFPPESLENYRLQKGDILLAEASGSRNEVGKPFIWNEQIPDCCFQNTLIRVRLWSLPPSFVHLHFLQDALAGRFGRVAKGIGIHHLGADRLSIFPIALPPLAEQHRIVAEVERRLSLVAALEASVEVALARAGRLRQAVLKQAFEGRLVPQDPDDEPASVLLERIKAERPQRERKSSRKEQPKQMELF